MNAEKLRQIAVEKKFEQITAAALEAVQTGSCQSVTVKLGRASQPFRAELGVRLREAGYGVSMFYPCDGGCDWGCRCRETPETIWDIKVTW